MNIQQILLSAIKKLQQKNTESAVWDAEILLAFVLNKPKEFLFIHPEVKLDKKQLKKFEKLITRRINFEPVAYLIGYKEFYGLKFFVNKNVLVPRPQSEEIIDKALEIIKKQLLIHDSRPPRPLCEAESGRGFASGDSRFVICDLGTGSGCLIIALAKKLQQLKMLNRFELLATDISPQALKVAKSNARLHQVDKHITFLRGDLLEPVIKRLAPNALSGGVALIMANLPYLNETDFKREKSIQAEPKKALLGNKSYQKLFQQISQLPYQPVVIFEDQQGVHIYPAPPRLAGLNNATLTLLENFAL